MMQDPDELLRQAIYEQSQRGSHYPSSFNNSARVSISLATSSPFLLYTYILLIF